jgi:hypothetical protein
VSARARPPTGARVAATKIMLIFVAIAFVLGWIALKVAWGVASFAVHALLALALLAVIAHFVRGRFGRTASS